MASQGKNGRDDGPAQGWDLFKWRWVTEPPVGLTAAVYGILSVLFFLIAISGIVALWQLLAPIWIGASPASSSRGTDPGAELRGRLLVIGALLTTPFLIWRLIVGHWSARAAQEQARIAQETVRNTLFTKAIEQLGATREERKTRLTEEISGVIQGFRDETNTIPNTEIRLGAIYALEKLARDDLEMHWPIMETLCAYVRENAEPPKPPDDVIIALLQKGIHAEAARNELAAHIRELAPPAVDIQAALTVIGRRSVAQRDFERIQRALAQATALSENAWRLDLARCDLARADLSGLNLDAVILEGSSLAFANCANANLIGARFDDAHLEGVRFMGTHLEKAWLSGAHLQGAWLNQAHFESATLRRAHLEGAFLAQANLQAADLTDAHLGSADLSLARLESARFERACFDGASFDRALTSDAFMDGADLSSAREMTQEQVEIMWGDSETKLPKALRRPTNDFWSDSGS